MKNGKNKGFDTDPLILSLSEGEKARLTAKASFLNISLQNYVSMLITSRLNEISGGKAKKNKQLH
jgi:hypothetical protein